jgi:hypothetical protein
LPYRPDFIMPPQPFIVRPAAPPQPAAGARRMAWALWRVAVLVGLAIALAVPVAVYAGTTRLGSARVATAVTTPSASAESDSPSVAATRRLQGILRLQSDALLAGDLTGFLAPVEPANAALRADLTRRFGSLRTMQVSVWDVRAHGLANPASDGSWTMTVAVRYCFVVRNCTSVQLKAETRWSITGDTIWLTAFGADADYGPSPWEASDLRAAVGSRVVVATTARYASRLPDTLSVAERAAQRADPYAKWVGPPTRYVVYLAGPDEWTKWFGVEVSKWAIGYTTFLSRDVANVVVNVSRVPAGRMLETLQHEFGHVVTLAGGRGDGGWWLVEGVAEYVRMIGNSSFGRIPDVRRFVRSGRWSGTVALPDPPASASSADVSAYYGIAYLAVRRLVDRFGEEKMLSFFEQVVREDRSVTDAARSTLGVGWDDVNADCVKYVRSRI